MPALPFTIALGRPSRGELLSLAGAAILVGSAASWVGTTARPTPPAAAEEPPPETAALGITSAPAGADVLVDGQSRGTTPATLAVLPGRHEVVVQAQDAIPERRVVEVEPGGSSLDLSLWRAHPTVTYLKPPLPGAVLDDVVFLEDGRLALRVALPDGEQQAWALDPDSRASSQRLGDGAAHAPLAVRPDGQAVAVLRTRADRPAQTARLSSPSTSRLARSGWSRPPPAPHRAACGRHPGRPRNCST